MDCSWEGLESNIWLFQDLWEVDISVSYQVSGPARLFTDFSSEGLDPCYKAVTKCIGMEFLGLAAPGSQTVAKRG